MYIYVIMFFTDILQHKITICYDNKSNHIYIRKYTMKRLFSVFSKDLAEKNMISFYQYGSLKLENDISGAFIYPPGMLFLIISVIFTIMFY